MSGDVQPRKRKDKKRKKDDSAEQIPPQLQTPPPPPSTNVVSDDLNIHVHKEDGTGGGICAKIVFFLLFSALAVLIGLIITEHRGLTDLDIVDSESRFSQIFEGWTDNGPSHDDEEDHLAHSLEDDHGHDDDHDIVEDDDHDEYADEEEPEEASEENNDDDEQDITEEEEEEDEDQTVESEEEEQEDEDDSDLKDADDEDVDEEDEEDASDEIMHDDEDEEEDDPSEAASEEKEESKEQIGSEEQSQEKDDDQEDEALSKEQDEDEDADKPAQETAEQDDEKDDTTDNPENSRMAVKIGVGVALLVVAHVVLVRKWKSAPTQEIIPKKDEPLPDLARRNTIVVPPTLEEVAQDLEETVEEDYSDEDGEIESDDDRVHLKAAKVEYQELRTTYSRSLTPESEPEYRNKPAGDDEEEYDEEIDEEDEEEDDEEGADEEDESDNEEYEKEDEDEELLNRLEAKYGKLHGKKLADAKQEDFDEQFSSWKRVNVRPDNEPEESDSDGQSDEGYEYENITGKDDWKIKEKIDEAQKEIKNE